MIQKLKFKNYRCFEDTEISFRDMSVIVGSNNSGKSTLIEALRITSLVVKKIKSAYYISAPRKLNLPLTTRGVMINVEHLKIDLRTIVNQYKEDTFAEIVAIFSKKVTINIYLSEETVFATIFVEKENITTRAAAKKIEDIHLNVMAQIGLIREDENTLTKETIIRDMDSRLSSRHFRNELWLYQDQFFGAFKEIAQETWKGLRVTELSHDVLSSKLELMLYDSDYAAEVGLMGSGLQMWLQIVWFISRCSPESTIVLDEPDVYMHPDLQIKIMKIAKNRFKQVIIATHSIEIISSADPHEIVVVDKKIRKLKYASDYQAVQNTINNLGSNHNLSLVRIGTAQKCVFVEGKDLKILSKFYEVLYSDSLTSLEQIPSVELGGWSRFDEALGTSRLFYDETCGGIKTICILDRDYHSTKELESLKKKAQENYLQLHIWEKKELENYIVIPKVVFRITNLPEEKYEEFEKALFVKIDDMKEKLVGCVSDQLFSYDRSKSPSFYRKTALNQIEEKWDTLEGRLSLVNGKDLISMINEWMKVKYHKNCTQAKLISAIKKEDIPKEIFEVIELLK